MLNILKKLIQKKKRNIVLIFHYTRCGSTALSESLDTNSNYSLGEILNPDTFIGKTIYSDIDFYKNDLINLTKLINSRCTDTNKTIYLEITIHDINKQIIWHELDDVIKFFSIDSNLKIIHLFRFNLLNRYISGALAEQSTIWHSTDGKQDIELKIDNNDAIADIYTHAMHILKSKYIFEKSGIQYTDIYYENFLKMGLNECIKLISLNLNLRIDFKDNVLYKNLGRYSHRIKNWPQITEQLSQNPDLDFFLRDPGNIEIY